MVGVGVGHGGVFTQDEQAAYLVAVDGVHHLHDRQADLLATRPAPGGLELGLGGVIHHPLVAGVVVDQAAGVTGALHVVLPAEWVHPAARHAHVAQQHLQVGARQHVLVPGGVLGDPHGIDEGSRAVGGQQACGFADTLGGDVGDLCGAFRRVGAHHGPQGVKALGARLHIFLVVQSLADQHVHDAVQQGDIRPRALPQVQGGEIGERDAPWVRHD